MIKSKAWLKNDLRKNILSLFSTKDMYGYEVKKRLELDGRKIEAARIYSILKELYNEGLIIDRWERSRSGPRKRVYSLGEKGKDALKANLLEAISVVHKSYGEYLMSLYPKVDIIGEILNHLVKGMDEIKNIGYFTNQYYGSTDMIISRIQQKIPEGSVYMIKPRSVDLAIENENVDFLTGTFEDFPLKDGFADLLLIIDLPKEEQLKSCIKEWHRVLSPEGNLGIITPSVLVKSRMDPISIGDFVEKHEHEVFGESNYVEGKYLKKELLNFFNNVEDPTFVHMMVISARQPIPQQ
jgi:PadR family transcriptional regulator PadR